MNKFILKKSCVYVVIMGIYIISANFLYEQTSLNIHKAILWNLFLALLPLGLAYVFLFTIKKKNKVLAVLSFCLWLFLFPNAPYMVTDLIHITPVVFYELTDTGPIYVQNILSWLQLFHIALGVCLGLFAGYRSLQMLAEYVKKRTHKIVEVLFIMLVAFISGYGVFLGRFLRLNSWDIMDPIGLVQEIFDKTNIFALEFSLGVGIFVLLSYTLYTFAGKRAK